MNSIDLDDLPWEGQFIYISMTKCALTFKKLQQSKKDFILLAEEIWNSMEMVDADHLTAILEQKIEKDLQNIR